MLLVFYRSSVAPRAHLCPMCPTVPSNALGFWRMAPGLFHQGRSFHGKDTKVVIKTLETGSDSPASTRVHDERCKDTGVIAWILIKIDMLLWYVWCAFCLTSNMQMAWETLLENDGWALTCLGHRQYLFFSLRTAVAQPREPRSA